MAEQEKQHDGLDEVNEALTKTEQIIEKYQKQIMFSVLAVVVVVTVILALRQYHFLPKEERAQADLFRGEFFFQDGDYKTAIEGNGGDYNGFEAIISENGSTKAGNLAKAYAGVSYMRLGDYQKAIKHLDSFSASDVLISPAIIGAIGDCYVELDQTQKAITYFEKAAKQANNELISPIYLKKAGIAYESLSQYPDAVKAYQAIKDQYPTSMEANDIEKYIERAKRRK